MGEYSLVKIVKSTKPEKKLMAVFKNKKTGREKKVHFGDATMSDYTKHKDKDRRKNYRSRHEKDLNTGDPMRAGFLSYYILWGSSTSQRESIKAYKKRFFPNSVRSPRRVTSPRRKPSPSPRRKLSDLRRWVDEKWTDEHGNVCGSSKNKRVKKCRPSVRINDETPATWEDIGKNKSKVVAEKKRVGMGARASPIKRKTSPVKRKTSPVKRKTSPVKRKTSPVKRKTSPVKRKTSAPTSKKDACYHKVKARYTRNGGTWPSAYGSLGLAKCRKVGAENWGESRN